MFFLGESEEGIFSYTRENTFYYDIHKFKIKYPKKDRKYVIEWNFRGMKMNDEGT